MSPYVQIVFLNLEKYLIKAALATFYQADNVLFRTQFAFVHCNQISEQILSSYFCSAFFARKNIQVFVCQKLDLTVASERRWESRYTANNVEKGLILICISEVVSSTVRSSLISHFNQHSIIVGYYILYCEYFCNSSAFWLTCHLKLSDCCCKKYKHRLPSLSSVFRCSSDVIWHVLKNVQETLSHSLFTVVRSISQ